VLGSQVLDLSFVDARHGWTLVWGCDPACTAAVDSTNDGGASWTRLASIGPFHAGEGRSAQVAFSDELNGYVVLGPPTPPSTSTSGQQNLETLFLTHDGGRTWRASRPPGPVLRVAAGSGEDWALTGTCDANARCQDALTVSVDRGRTWTQRSVLPPMPPSPLFVRDRQSGWIYASDLEATTTLLYTGDGGRHWSPQRSPCPSTANAALAVTEGGHLWLVCGGEPGAGQQQKSVFRSTDGGEHWQLTASSGLGSSPPTGTIGGSGYVGVLAASSDQKAWLGLNRGTLGSTDDGGTTWASQPSFPPPEVFFGGLQFIDSQTGWAGVVITSDSRGNGIYRTTDGGRTWTHSSIP
jgi:photosystem II stability/assembly factor-like uncharacterized protein